MSRLSTRRMIAGVLFGAVLGLGPTVLSATGQVSPPESPPTTTTVPPSQAVPIGSTWYANGQNTQSGPVGTTIRAFGVAALRNVAYRLVLGSGDPGKACVNTVQVLNPSSRFANTSGFVAMTVGVVQPGIAPGTYKLCFEDSSPGNFTGTAGGTFTVLASP